MVAHALQVASAVADLVQFRRTSLHGEVSLRSLQAAGTLDGQAPPTPHTPKRGWFSRGASPAQARAEQPSCSIQDHSEEDGPCAHGCSVPFSSQHERGSTAPSLRDPSSSADGMPASIAKRAWDNHAPGTPARGAVGLQGNVTGQPRGLHHSCPECRRGSCLLGA